MAVGFTSQLMGKRATAGLGVPSILAALPDDRHAPASCLPLTTIHAHFSAEPIKSISSQRLYNNYALAGVCGLQAGGCLGLTHPICSQGIHIILDCTCAGMIISSVQGTLLRVSGRG
jgi:hypothetical protein